jgi:hypothetical protein
MEDVKNGLIAWFRSVILMSLIYIVIFLLCTVLYVIDMSAKEAQAVAEIQLIVQEVCNLPDYEAEQGYLDRFDHRYDHSVESENLLIYCTKYPDWECSCRNEGD